MSQEIAGIVQYLNNKSIDLSKWALMVEEFGGELGGKLLPSQGGSGISYWTFEFPSDMIDAAKHVIESYGITQVDATWDGNKVILRQP